MKKSLAIVLIVLTAACFGVSGYFVSNAINDNADTNNSEANTDQDTLKPIIPTYVYATVDSNDGNIITMTISKSTNENISADTTAVMDVKYKENATPPSDEKNKADLKKGDFIKVNCLNYAEVDGTYYLYSNNVFDGNR